MAIFGDEDNMVERLVEIDARGFLDGTLTSRRVFQLTGPGTRRGCGTHSAAPAFFVFFKTARFSATFSHPIPTPKAKRKNQI